MDDRDPLRAIVRRWFPTTSFTIGPPPGGGFSGSPVAVVETIGASGAPAARFVLKGFAEGWPRERAEAIHRLMATARRAGVGAVPANLTLAATDDRPPASIAVDGAGRCWEISEWRPGHPVAAPSPRQATAALETLARIHVALRNGGGSAEARYGPPPAWRRRVEVLRAVIERGWDEPIEGALTPLQAAVAERRAAAATILRRRGGLSWLARLAAIEPAAVPLQAVLRDVWRAHLLFVGEEVSAVIDWHAAGIDTRSTDLARLLGSWTVPTVPSAGDASQDVVWREALEAYRAIVPLAREELVLVDLLHSTGVVGSLHHWFTWVLDDRRDFSDAAAVLARVDALLKNLVFLGEKTDGGSGGFH